jgi:DNA-binding transcriptional ArsR family regulator
MGRIPAASDPFRAIADPGRRRMLDAMLEGEQSVGALTDLLGISQPSVSQHLQVLKEAGLVRERQEGRHRFYRAEAAALRKVAVWIAQYEAFWKGKLDALGRHLARRKN